MVSKKDVLDAARQVLDPELGLNIVDLGLIYEVDVNRGNVKVKMTFTTPACPMLQYMVSNVEESIAKLQGVDSVSVQLVWDPPWTPDRISEAGKKQLGL